MPTPESPPVIFQAKPCARTGRKKTQNRINMKYWEIIADKLSKAGVGAISQLWINPYGWLLLLTFEESDIFVRATGVNRDSGKLPTLRSLSVRLID